MDTRQVVPMAAVKGWLGSDIRAALVALEAMPMKIETHAEWMETRRHLLNASKSLAMLERLSRWIAGDQKGDQPGAQREIKGTIPGRSIDIAGRQRRYSADSVID